MGHTVHAMLQMTIRIPKKTPPKFLAWIFKFSTGCSINMAAHSINSKQSRHPCFFLQGCSLNAQRFLKMTSFQASVSRFCPALDWTVEVGLLFRPTSIYAVQNVSKWNISYFVFLQIFHLVSKTKVLSNSSAFTVTCCLTLYLRLPASTCVYLCLWSSGSGRWCCVLGHAETERLRHGTRSGTGRALPLCWTGTRESADQCRTQTHMKRQQPGDTWGQR